MLDVIILAAGLGSRLKDKTLSEPKPMIKVKDLPLIEYDLSFVEEISSINKVIIVTGYLSEQIEKFVSNRKNKVLVETVFNKNYKQGNLYSLLCGFNQLDNDNNLLIMNADHIYPLSFSKIINEHVLSRSNSIISFCDFDRNLTNDDMKVKLKNERIFKIHKQLDDYDGGYIGATFIGKGKKELYQKHLENLKERDNEKKAVVENVIQELANNSEEVEIVDFSGYQWFEVDDQKDLEKVETLITSKR